MLSGRSGSSTKFTELPHNMLATALRASVTVFYLQHSLLVLSKISILGPATPDCTPERLLCCQFFLSSFFVAWHQYYRNPEQRPPHPEHVRTLLPRFRRTQSFSVRVFFIDLMPVHAVTPSVQNLGEFSLS